MALAISRRDGIAHFFQAVGLGPFMLMLLSVTYFLLALLFGGYATYFLVTLIPERVLEQASRSGRFADLHDGPAGQADSAPVDMKAASVIS
ncbi:hypothetical protein AWV79_26880 [Cupriavidus sp. UYMMa02A]|nr:hypothetical protein AWV79_26880 [Cupriavidus sp. UYMMa02A]